MLEIAKIFSEGMILQREKRIAVWGYADVGVEVIVSIQNQSADVVTGGNGKWHAVLGPLVASQKEVLVVKAQEEEIRINDVAVGEVWIAGGQSNMEFPLRYEKYCKEEMYNTNMALRFYDVPEISFKGQDTNFDYSNVGVWRKAGGDDLLYFSAVGYYFQKELEEDLSVPVGIVGCNWGGTRSSAWMKEETVRRVGKPWMELYEDSIAGLDMGQYWEEQKVNPINNTGNPNADPVSAVLLQRTPSMEELRQISAQTGVAMEISPNGTDAEDVTAFQNSVDPKNRPGCLYENMLLEIAPYTIRGVLWYQGESDDVPGLQHIYADMLTALIADWREAWKEDALPFFVVQLPGWKSWMMQTNLDYTVIRQCQERVANSVVGVYLASISDVGEEKDIHPKDKRTVGHRLALLARHYVYGEELLCEAPVADKAEHDGERIVITFKNAGSSLKIAGNTVEALTITKDGKQIDFSAVIDEDKLVLTLSEKAEGMLDVNFAQGAWYAVNLFNAADIPAIPFRVKC